jgi:hypothetical protein
MHLGSAPAPNDERAAGAWSHHQEAPTMPDPLSWTELPQIAAIKNLPTAQRWLVVNKVLIDVRNMILPIIDDADAGRSFPQPAAGAGQSPGPRRRLALAPAEAPAALLGAGFCWQPAGGEL